MYCAKRMFLQSLDNFCVYKYLFCATNLFFLLLGLPCDLLEQNFLKI